MMRIKTLSSSNENSTRKCKKTKSSVDDVNIQMYYNKTTSKPVKKSKNGSAMDTLTLLEK